MVSYRRSLVSNYRVKYQCVCGGVEIIIYTYALKYVDCDKVGMIGKDETDTSNMSVITALF